MQLIPQIAPLCGSNKRIITNTDRSRVQQRHGHVIQRPSQAGHTQSRVPIKCTCVYEKHFDGANGSRARAAHDLDANGAMCPRSRMPGAHNDMFCISGALIRACHSINTTVFHVIARSIVCRHNRSIFVHASEKQRRLAVEPRHRGVQHKRKRVPTVPIQPQQRKPKNVNA